MVSYISKYSSMAVLAATLVACSTAVDKTDVTANVPAKHIQSYTLQLNAKQTDSTVQLEALATGENQARQLNAPDINTARLLAGAEQALAAISEACLALNNEMLDSGADRYQVGEIQVRLLADHYRVDQVLQDGLLVQMQAGFDALKGCQFEGNHSLSENRQLMISAQLESAQLSMQVKPSTVHIDFAAGQPVSATWSEYGYAAQADAASQALSSTLLQGNLNATVTYKNVQQNSWLSQNTLE